MNKDKFFTDLDSIRLCYYNKHYHEARKSWKEIANMLGTYPNRVRRDAKKLGVKSRNKSDAQKVALAEGRIEHPTAGKKHSQETKLKISESQGAVWDSMNESELEYRSEIGRDSWNKKTDDEKTEFFKKGGQAIQEASRTGSKVERHLFDFLTSLGYKVDRHCEFIQQNERFHIDLYIKDLSIAIEVDGPMHFEPVFGEEKLRRRQSADSIKTGLILTGGMVLIRVKLVKRESQRYLRTLCNDIFEVVELVGQAFPEEGKRYFEI